MSFLSDNMGAIVVALVASVVSWLFGGARADLLTPVVPWMSLFMVEVLLFFPQRRRGEDVYGARRRVWSELRHDPLVLVSVGFLALLVVPFANSGLCVVCDAEKIAALGLSPKPPIPFIPFCVNRLDHLTVFLWFAAVVPAMLVVRHGLARRGKRLVLEMIVWNGMALAALGFVQSALRAPGPFWDTHNGTFYGTTTDFFSVFGYSNMAGDYFTFLFGLAVALWRDHYERMREEFETKDISKSAPKRPRMFWKKHYFLIPAVLFYFAAVHTLSRAAIVLVTVTACVYFMHTLAAFFARMRRVGRVKASAWCLLGFLVVVLLAIKGVPERVQHEAGTLNAVEMLDRVTGKRMDSVRVATEIWKDHKLFGCGGWGFVHFALPKMNRRDIDMELQVVGGANVHNDYMQFPAEHGLVGFAALVTMVVLLLVPVGRRWRELAHDALFMTNKHRLPRPVQLFALPAGAFFTLIAAFATLIHAFGDCPLRSLAILLLLFISLAAVPGFLPREK